MSEDVTFCGVFDGHGPQGHLVARKVRDALPVKLLSYLNSYESRGNASGKASIKGEIKPETEESEKDFCGEDTLSAMWREAFMKAYKAMDKELKSHPNLDCFCSGSTSVTIVKQVTQREASIYPLLLSSTHFLLSSLSRVQVCSWGVLEIREQSWEPRTAMT